MQGHSSESICIEYRRLRAIQDYLDEILSNYYYLDFRGIAQLERIVSLELDEVFVPLKAVPLAIEGESLRRWWSELMAKATRAEAETFHLSGHGTRFSEAPESKLKLLVSALKLGKSGLSQLASLVPGLGLIGESAGALAEVLEFSGELEKGGTRLHALEKLALQQAGVTSGSPQEFRGILASNRQMVLVGDPGSGKTTLIKWLARSYALGPSPVQERLGLDENLVPIVIPVAKYARDCAEFGGDLLPVADYVEQAFDKRRQGLGKPLREIAEGGGAFLLFDGLDEVPEITVRLEASRRIESCLRSCREKGEAGSRCLVTSRRFGYDLCRISDVPHWELAPFDNEAISKFSHGWFKAMEKALRPAAPCMDAATRSAEDLIHTITSPSSPHHDSLQGFATNPLLLTIVALVRWQLGILPERRAKLYELALTTLIETWNQMRGLGGPVEGVQLNAAQTMHLWEPIALWMHTEYPGGTAPRGQILTKLAEALMRDGTTQEAAYRTAVSYLDTAARWAGLLIERGDGAFGFVHQTFQEYLAARALVGEAADAYGSLVSHFNLHDPRWHEVVLLSAGYLGEVQARPQASTKLVEKIRDTSDVLEPILHRYLLLAADVMADRAPVSATCRTKTVIRLLDIASEPFLSHDVADALAATCWLEPEEPVIRHIEEAYVGNASWVSRAALLVVAAGDNERGEQFLTRALHREDDDDVRGLAAAILLARKDATPIALAGLLKPWVETGANRLDSMARQYISEVLRKPAIQAELAALLKNKDPEIRLLAANVFRSAGPASGAALEGLLASLRDQDPYVWSAAVEALQSIRPLDAEAEWRLLALLRDKNPEVSTFAAELLQSVRPLSDQEQRGLVALLQDRDQMVRVRAAEVLRSVRPLSETEQSVIVGLLQDDNPGVRVRAAEVLRSVRPLSQTEQETVVSLLQNSKVWVRSRAVSVMKSIRPLSEGAQADLVSLLQDTNPFVRGCAAEVLLSARPLSATAETGLLAILEDEEPGVRLFSAELLHSIRPLREPEQVGLMTLLQDKDSGVRVRAAEVLHSLRRLSDAEQRCLVDLLQDSDLHVGSRAAEVLCSIRPLSEVAQAGLVALLKDEDPAVRIRAAEVLQSVRPLSEAEQAGLVVLLESEDVRFEAAQLLAKTIASIHPSPTWLKSRPGGQKAESAPVNLKPVRTHPESVRELLERALLKPDDRSESVRSRLAAAVSPRGTGSVSKALSEVADAIKEPRLLQALAAPDSAASVVRDILAKAFADRLRELIGRRQTGASNAARLEIDLTRMVPILLVADVMESVFDDLTEASRKVALAEMLDADFDRAAPETKCKLLSFYGRFCSLAQLGQRDKILRRIYRASDADEAEVRVQACQSLAVFLPELQGKARERCFGALLEAASGEQEATRTAACESLRLIYGYLKEKERTALRREGIRLA